MHPVHLQSALFFLAYPPLALRCSGGRKGFLSVFCVGIFRLTSVVCRVWLQNLCFLSCYRHQLCPRQNCLTFPRRESNPDPKDFLGKWEPYILTVRQRGSYLLHVRQKSEIHRTFSSLWNQIQHSPSNSIHVTLTANHLHKQVYPLRPSDYSI